MKYVNQRIAKCRKLANLTQTDVAEKLGIKCSTYSQMERKGLVTAERLFEMSKIFGVTPCYLYDGKEPCREEAIKIKEPAMSVMSQPAIEKPKAEIFTVTKKEESLIKILRSFSKEDYAKTISFINELYNKENN